MYALKWFEDSSFCFHSFKVPCFIKNHLMAVRGPGLLLILAVKQLKMMPDAFFNAAAALSFTYSRLFTI